jgi:hypothetical protein
MPLITIIFVLPAKAKNSASKNARRSRFTGKTVVANRPGYTHIPALLLSKLWTESLHTITLLLHQQLLVRRSVSLIVASHLHRTLWYALFILVSASPAESTGPRPFLAFDPTPKCCGPQASSVPSRIPRLCQSMEWLGAHHSMHLPSDSS